MARYREMELLVDPNDSEHRGFYEEAKNGRLVVQKCKHCAKLRTTIGSACPFCTSPDWNWHQVSGFGTIFSWQIVTHAVHPAFRELTPYPIVLIQLDEQQNEPWNNGEEGETVSLRMVTNLCTEDPSIPEREEKVAIGHRVEVCFVDLDDQTALPQFKLVQ